MFIIYGKNGLIIDVFLLYEREVSIIFFYNCVYFLVDVDIVSEMVDFLCLVMLMKSLGELYNFIGFEKYGKMVFYCDFECYLV